MQYYIKPGTVDGGVCHVRGEGSCDPGEEPGDIQVKISVQKHDQYTLKGSDLVCTQRVTLAELLRGQLVSTFMRPKLRRLFNFLIQCKVMTLKHIDGRTYKLVAPASPAPRAGSVYIAEGDSTLLQALCISSQLAAPGLGMPVPSTPERGRLAVVIEAVFPDAVPALAEVFVTMAAFVWGYDDTSSTVLISRASHISDCRFSSRGVRQQRKVCP